MQITPTPWHPAGHSKRFWWCPAIQTRLTWNLEFPHLCVLRTVTCTVTLGSGTSILTWHKMCRILESQIIAINFFGCLGQIQWPPVFLGLPVTMSSCALCSRQASLRSEPAAPHASLCRCLDSACLDASGVHFVFLYFPSPKPFKSLFVWNTHTRGSIVLENFSLNEWVLQSP